MARKKRKSRRYSGDEIRAKNALPFKSWISLVKERCLSGRYKHQLHMERTAWRMSAAA